MVVGSGPAGCACAIALALDPLNFNVYLVDNEKVIDQTNKAIFKVGESLPGAAMRLLNRLGIANIDDLLSSKDYKQCIGNVSAWGQDNWFHQDAMINPEGSGWHLSRHRFDLALREKAIALGVKFIDGKVGEIKDNSAAVNITSTSETSPDYPSSVNKNKKWAIKVFLQNDEQVVLNSDWCVDATGRQSFLSKKLGEKKIRLDTQMAALCWLKPNSNDIDNTTRIKSARDGWWYSARLPCGHRVLAFFSLPRNITKFFKQPSDYISEANDIGIVPYKISEESMQSQLQVTDASVSKLQKACGVGWLAVGDAALSFDPLSSQGMFFALYSGIRGAESILLSHSSEGTTDDIAAKTMENSLAQYQQTIDKVFKVNQNSQRYYYANEGRFTNSKYWSTRFVKV